ncbi:MAG TPA: LysM peptidoglycan-binding domain-containing protein [Paludibacteraceae bacterium]|jgi:LysM repeat protein|nr:LysM peptidoglycan-binding domain-containing protein [Paludibacteraceae bacterium]HPW96290.1 LysM peptidoglycan-binding domain-containing protein [Paludibacteraceae bacterium]
MKKIVYLIVFLNFIFFSVFAEKYPIRIVKGKKYYEYAVQKSEGLFAVGRKFEVSQAQLLEANPELAKQTGLKLGQIILVPVIEKAEENEDAQKYEYYVVPPKQTLYSLSRQKGVSIDELVELNPELKDGLKAGQTLKIPIKEVPTPTVAQPLTDTLPDKGKPTKMDRKVRKSLLDSVRMVFERTSPSVEKPVVEEQQRDTDVVVAQQPTLNVVLMLPFMVQTPDLEGISDKFIEFYKGVLIALDAAKKGGVSVKLAVFDNEKSPETLDSLLTNPQLKTANLIIGPAYSAQADKVLDFAKANGIYTVIPFTSHLGKHADNPYLIQFNPSQEELFTVISEQIVRKIGKNKVIIARFQDAEDDKVDMFVAMLEQTMMAHRKNYNEFFISKENVGVLQDLAARNGTLLVLASRNTKEIAGLLPDIEALNIPNLSLWGFEEWGNEWLSYLPNTYYYSLFNAKSDTEEYNKTYHYFYGNRAATSIPAYDMLGHDIMSYFTTTWKNNQSHIFPFSKPCGADYLQSNIVFSQSGNQKKWINLNYYLFHYNGKQMLIIEK